MSPTLLAKYKEMYLEWHHDLMQAVEGNVAGTAQQAACHWDSDSTGPQLNKQCLQQNDTILLFYQVPINKIIFMRYTTTVMKSEHIWI
jgi:hypothetical protein